MAFFVVLQQTGRVRLARRARREKRVRRLCGGFRSRAGEGRFQDELPLIKAEDYSRRLGGGLYDGLADASGQSVALLAGIGGSGSASESAP